MLWARQRQNSNLSEKPGHPFHEGPETHCTLYQVHLRYIVIGGTGTVFGRDLLGISDTKDQTRLKILADPPCTAPIF